MSTSKTHPPYTKNINIANDGTTSGDVNVRNVSCMFTALCSTAFPQHYKLRTGRRRPIIESELEQEIATKLFQGLKRLINGQSLEDNNYNDESEEWRPIQFDPPFIDESEFLPQQPNNTNDDYDPLQSSTLLEDDNFIPIAKESTNAKRTYGQISTELTSTRETKPPQNSVDKDNQEEEAMDDGNNHIVPPEVETYPPTGSDFISQIIQGIYHAANQSKR